MCDRRRATSAGSERQGQSSTSSPLMPEALRALRPWSAAKIPSGELWVDGCEQAEGARWRLNRAGDP